MAEYESLVEKVAIHVSPCPEPAILDALKNTVRDFCKKTKGWVFDVPEVLLDPDVMNYELDIPDQSTVIHVWGVYGRTGRYSETADYYLSFPNTLVFNERVPQRSSLKPLVSLMPGLASSEFPDYLAEYFSDYLVSGAVAYLQMQPFRDWSQPNAAEIHLQKYAAGIHEAERLRDQGLNLSKATGRVRPQYI